MNVDIVAPEGGVRSSVCAPSDSSIGSKNNLWGARGYHPLLVKKGGEDKTRQSAVERCFTLGGGKTPRFCPEVAPKFVVVKTKLSKEDGSKIDPSKSGLRVTLYGRRPVPKVL